MIRIAFLARLTAYRVGLRVDLALVDII